MSSISAPFGLRPAYKEGGTPVSTSILGTILSTYNANIFLYSPVKIGTDGTLQLAAAGEAFVGAFMGVEYKDPATQRQVLSNRWLAGTVAEEVQAYYSRDPYITYQIQADGPVAVTNIGNQADTTVATAGNAVTGLSEVMLATAGLVDSGEFKQLRVVGIPPGPDNAPGDAFTIVEVQISDHQYVAGRNAI